MRPDSADELAEWLRQPPPLDERSAAVEVLNQGCRILKGQTAIVIWGDPEEPWVQLAHLDPNKQVHLETVNAVEPLVAAELQGHSTFHLRGAGSSPLLANGELLECQKPVLSESIANRLVAGDVAGAWLDGDGFEGWLLVSRPTTAEDEDTWQLTGLIAAVGSSRLQQVAITEKMRRQAVSEELIRVARDLHDGLLQSFTGVVLQLETVHQTLERDPDNARRLLTQVESVLMADQRELRAYLERLRPVPGRRAIDWSFDLRERLQDLIRRFRDEWNIQVSIDIAPMDELVGHSLGWETYRIISEAVSNSAKHGGATEVRVDVKAESDTLHIHVEDDGIGLSVRGRYNLAELNERREGPAILGERVASLNGQVIIESTEQGLRLDITLPMGWRGT